MKNNNIDCPVTFYALQWDTNYFGINCAKAILHKPLTSFDWDELKDKFKAYQFISIENRNSEPNNAQLIAKHTSAFLADVNIQFTKKIEGSYKWPEQIEIHNMLERNDQIIDVADFQFSKFTEDPELAKRGGTQVYKQWLINSFGKSEKYFALSKELNGQVNGFLLHSYLDKCCVIELIAVARNGVKCGIGTSLFKAIEHAAFDRGCDEIRVGTQVRNIGAINFYHKVGCKQVECHQVYHLWYCL